jgi:hypothetical protein
LSLSLSSSPRRATPAPSPMRPRSRTPRAPSSSPLAMAPSSSPSARRRRAQGSRRPPSFHLPWSRGATALGGAHLWSVTALFLSLLLDSSREQSKPQWRIWPQSPAPPISPMTDTTYFPGHQRRRPPPPTTPTTGGADLGAGSLLHLLLCLWRRRLRRRLGGGRRPWDPPLCWRWNSVNLAMSLPSVLAWLLYLIHWY